VLAFIGSAPSVAPAAQIFAARRGCAAIIARLDDSPRVAVIPSPPPCPSCADAGLLAPFGPRAAAADFVAMVAAAEALKLLAAFVEQPNAQLIEFAGYESRTRRPLSASRCDCGAPIRGDDDNGR